MTGHTWTTTSVNIPLLTFSQFDDGINESFPITIRADRIESYAEVLGHNRVFVVMMSGQEHHFDVSHQRFGELYADAMKGQP